MCFYSAAVTVAFCFCLYTNAPCGADNRDRNIFTFEAKLTEMQRLYFIALLLFTSSLSYGLQAPKAFNDTASVIEAGTVLINVLANDSNYNIPDSVCLTRIWGAPAGWAVIQGCRQIKFHPLVATFTGPDTFYYRSCDAQHSTLCDTGRVIVNVIIRAPKAKNDTATVLALDSVAINVLTNDSNFNRPDTLLVTSATGTHSSWVRVKDSTQVIIHPLDTNFYGLVRFTYISCDKRRTSLCDTGTIVVNVIRKPKAYIDTITILEPDTAFVNVTANDSDLNVMDSACITRVWGSRSSWAAIRGCGTIAFHPAVFDHHGIDTLYYRSCYTKTTRVCDTGMMVVNVILPKPYVDFSYVESPVCVALLTNNSTLADSVHWTVQFLTHNGTNRTVHDSAQISVVAHMDSDFQAQVCLTAFNAAGDTTVCYSFWIQCAFNTDIASLALGRLAVYPDPASDLIQLRNTASVPSGCTLAIYDLLGREVVFAPIHSEAISVRDLSEGIYTICLKDKDHNRLMLSKFEVRR